MRHKIAFIKTVLEGYPFPEVYIASGDVDLETARGNLMLVDGQQRLTTLYDYFHGSNDLRLKDVIPYEKLDNAKKRDFLEYEVVVRDLGTMEIDQMKEVFRRMNSTSYALNAMEIDNPRTAYPPASGATECCDGRGRFVLEQITNITTFGGPDDRFSPFLDRVPAALLG
jgi:hypothetical protein